jgi:transposase
MLTQTNSKPVSLKYDMRIGVDTSQKSYAVTYKSNDGHGRSMQMASDPEALHGHFQKRFPEKRLLYIYEAGATGYDLYDYLTAQGQDCWVLHPPSIEKPANQRVKNNRIDSEILADQGNSEKIKSIRVPDFVYRQLRHLAITRQQYVQDSQRTKQRIKSLLLFESIRLPQEILQETSHWSRRYREALKQVPVKNETLRFKLDMHLKDLEHHHENILRVHRQLQHFYKQHPEIHQYVEYLRSIPGFGFVVSMYLLSRIGEPKNLKSPRELGSFAGVVPSEHSTGEHQTQGPITHMGDKIMRCLLVEAAWIAIRKDHELYEFYQRIRSRNPVSKGSKIAIVAVARKLTHRAYRVLKDQRPYGIH